MLAIWDDTVCDDFMIDCSNSDIFVVDFVPATFWPMAGIDFFVKGLILDDEETKRIQYFQKDHALQRLEVAPLRAPGVEIPTRVVMSP
jgi:hypothetical protein